MDYVLKRGSHVREKQAVLDSHMYLLIQSKLYLMIYISLLLLCNKHVKSQSHIAICYLFLAHVFVDLLERLFKLVPSLGLFDCLILGPRLER